MFKKNLIFALAVSLFSATAHATLKCTHIVDEGWSAGFHSHIRVHNAGNKSAVWEVRWRYTNKDTKVSTGWSAKLKELNGVYTAWGRGWAFELEPGGVHEFGIGGSGADKAAVILYCGSRGTKPR